MKNRIFPILCLVLFFTGCKNDDDVVLDYTYRINVSFSEASSLVGSAVIVTTVAEYAKEARNRAMEKIANSDTMTVSDVPERDLERTDSEALLFFADIFAEVEALLQVEYDNIETFKTENAEELSNEPKYARYFAMLRVSIQRINDSNGRSIDIKESTYTLEAMGGKED